ncbi:MAG: hypothetical protein ACOYMV_10080 [Verrucomicrobiia bacterium]
MSRRQVLKLAILLVLYALCILAWDVEQSLGIGRQFVYAVF